MQRTDKSEQLEPLGLLDLTKALVQHYGLTEGKYNLSAEFHVGTGMFGPNEGKRGPGFAIGLSRVGLLKAPVDGPYTVDASTVAGRSTMQAAKKPTRKQSKRR